MLPVDLGRCLRAADVRAETGLLTNDSIIVATMRDAGLTAIATADGDFERVEGVQVYRPTDLGIAHAGSCLEAVSCGTFNVR